MYELGTGVKKNREKAFELWKQAALAGHEKAKYLYDVETYYEYEEWYLAMDYYHGTNGHEQNISKALEILEKGVNVCNDVGALMLLGLVDIAGALPYVPQNVEEGVNKLVQAAKKGESEAFAWLMRMYEHGTTCEGVIFEKNERMAGKIAVEIANEVDENVNDALLGQIYGKAARACIKGCGVPVDYEKASMFYEKIKENHRKGFILEIGDELKNKGY
jgi:TPR repeat protein